MMRPFSQQMAAGLSSAVTAFCRWWSPKDHQVVEGIIREIVNKNTLVWLMWALGGAGVVRLGLCGLETYDGGKIPNTLQRLYPKGWKEVRDAVEGLPSRVLSNIAGDCLQLCVSLTLAKILEYLGAIRLVPGTRFTSFLSVYNCSAGIAHHRITFIMTSCIPPLFRSFMTCPPRGSLSQSQVLHLERSSGWQDLLLIEAFPAVVRMASSCINLYIKKVFGKLTRGVYTSFLNKNSAMLLWLASLAILTPLAQVRHHLSVRPLHLVPFVVFFDVVYSSGCFSWLFGGLFTWYYRNKGVLCPTIFPPAFLLTLALEEQRVGRDEEEESERMRIRTAVASAASSLQQSGLEYDLNTLQESLESQLSSMSPEQAINVLMQLTMHQGSHPSLRTTTKLLTLTPANIDTTSDVCTVCQGPFEIGSEIRILSCKHYYHRGCIDPWISYHRNCPLCRKDVFAPTPRPLPRHDHEEEEEEDEEEEDQYHGSTETDLTDSEDSTDRSMAEFAHEHGLPYPNY
eukprot:TRINITY_DN7635_c0_g1_i1.p1 TRINITY_DN7635_c0_g1~~TRINITY_DN7635_c0_g1_i1.p1  ORF type:complete len:547 (+),score=93.78 TRINITY_DN7635_c0_g1_i1:108-1643(+)